MERDESDLEELLALNRFKQINGEEKKDLAMYFSPKTQTYIFKFKGSEWCVGTSLEHRNNFPFWVDKLEQFLTKKRFDLERVFRMLAGKRLQEDSFPTGRGR